MIPQTDSRLAIIAVFLSLVVVIFTFELVAIIWRFVLPFILRVEIKRTKHGTMFRHLIAPVTVGLLGTVLIPLVSTGKYGAMPGMGLATRCANAAVDADVGGDGIRVAVWAQESVLLLLALLGTFHYSTTGAKEIGAALAITHFSLAIALLVQMGRGTLTSANAILGSMILDSQSSALSIQLVAKETLAARWQVGIIVACQAFGLAVLATFVDGFGRGAYAVKDCGCIAVFWWGWLSDCLAFPSREMSIWWTYYACRCLTVVQCGFHSVTNAPSFHYAEKNGTPVKVITYPEMAVASPSYSGAKASGARQAGTVYKDYPSTVTLMYTVYGIFALTSMASAEIAIRDAGLSPSSEVFSVGQIIALVVTGVTVVRAFWLLVMMFLSTGTGYVWPFSFDTVKGVVGWSHTIASVPKVKWRVPGEREPGEGEIVCGPLLNYRGMEGTRWLGSVLVITKGGGKHQDFKPTLLLGRAGQAIVAVGGDDGGGDGPSSSTTSTGVAQISARCLYSDQRNTFWAFDLAADMEEVETKWGYALPELAFASSRQPLANYFFFVPAKTESMRIMFYSCNGFSIGTDESAWSRGGGLWADVLRRHAETPFHVMIGGGDQIYNDDIRVSGPLDQWIRIANPKRRLAYPFESKMRDYCDDYSLMSYIRSYAAEPFASANGQIPQLNIWGSHDIIGSYGSYADELMRCAVFRGVGSIAYKYYMLFQHHLPPPPSTFTTDVIDVMTSAQGDLEAAVGSGQQQERVENAYVAQRKIKPNYIVGARPGPYIGENSYHIYAQLGARIAFLGIDTMTERTRHQVNLHQIYDVIFSRLTSELEAAAHSESPIKHLVLLLGNPIAYPRLTWLKKVLKSPLFTPIKFINRRYGALNPLFNCYDGSLRVLDELDSSYTARAHKKERDALIKRLQTIAAACSVRITILSGNTHMAAVGRFYSRPALQIPTEHDRRYMVNVISSAIVNKPPPHSMADVLTRLNKMHHLDADTDETLLDLFDKDVIMPSRNYAMLAENSPNNQAECAPSSSSVQSNFMFSGKDDRKCLHAGELHAGTKHKAAGNKHGTGKNGSLDVCILVEMNQHDAEGHTETFGLTVPSLACRPPVHASTQEK